MATKTKTSDNPAPAPASMLDQAFSDGLGQLNAGRLAEAGEIFTRVQAEAVAQGQLTLARSCRLYLAAIETRAHAGEEKVEKDPALTAQLALNRKAAAEALEILQPALAAEPGRAVLHYLAAVAKAQLEQGEGAAESLGRAIELDETFLFQFRLEPDFDTLRHSAAFANLAKA